MTAERIAVLFNPSAGKGKAAARLEEVEARLRDQGLAYDLFVTRSEAELKDLAARSGRNRRIVVGAGGDSTFHLIVNELVRAGAPAAFGMIGTGSSNDIDREFGLDSVAAACRALKEGRKRRIDLGAIRSRGRIERYFLGQANIGLGFAVNRYIEGLAGKRPGLAARQNLAGLMGIFRAYRSGEVPVRLTVRSGKESVTDKFAAAVFANIRYWATGRIIVPDAEPDDGLLDACLIRMCPIPRLARVARLALGGRHGKLSEVGFARTRAFEILSDTPFGVQTDGEILGPRARPDMFEHIVIENVPGAIEIIAGGWKCCPS